MEKIVRWNLGKPGGWEDYSVISDEKSVDIIKIVKDETKTIEEIASKVEKIHEDVKFKAFGKTTIKSGVPKPSIQVVENSEEEAKNLIERQSNMIEKEIKELKESKQGRSAKIFKVAEKIRGPKKGFIEPQAVKDPNSGKLVVSSQEIQKVCLDHCVM